MVKVTFLQGNCSDRMESRFTRLDCWILFLIILATLSVYFQVGHFDFVNYDTLEYVYDNIHVKQGLTLEGINWALTTTYMSNWHPLTWMSHMLDVTLFGLAPGPHHLMNLAIHILNTVLLYILFLIMTWNSLESGLVAALFAIHPLHVQSVAWVAERKDLLSTMFFFLSIMCYVRYLKTNNFKRYFAVLLFFILGLMSKPMIVTLPFVLLLLDFWPLRRISYYQSHQNEIKPPYSILIDKIPLLFLCAASSIITIFAQQSGGAISSLSKIPFATRLANSLVSYIIYLKKIFWPDNLAVIYPYSEQIPGTLILLSSACIIGISALGFKLLKSRPWISVGWLWFLGTLVPVIGFVQVGMQAMADRYTYIPSVGIFIIMSWTFSYLLEKGWFDKRPMIVIAVIILSIYSVVTWKQVGYWRNSKMLFEHAISVTENNFIAHNNLGQKLLESNKIEKALWHFNRAININPTFEIAHLNLGLCLSKKGKLERAIEHYQIALKINPEYAMAYNNLGNAYFRQSEYKQAVSSYLQALQLKPDFSEAYSNLGMVMILLGNNDKAIELFQKVVNIDPGNEIAQQNLKALLSIHK